MRGLDADASPGHKGQKGEPGQEIVYTFLFQKSFKIVIFVSPNFYSVLHFFHNGLETAWNQMD